MRHRNVAAHALRLPERSDVWLFDCGEGTQHRLMTSDVSTGRITRIFITHLHGDHLFGLPGLLATCGMSGGTRRIDLYGPAGLERFLSAALEISGTWIPFTLRIHVVEPGTVVTDGELTVTAARLDHRIETFGYRVQESERAGTFHAERARTLSVPEGPLFGALKSGERITLPDGTVVDGRDLTGSPAPGRSLAYCSDTTYSPAAVELARDADILLHEATFIEREREIAEMSFHSTAAMAARTALEAGARRLLLTHLSSRYAGDGEARLLEEARAIFPATELAEDLKSYRIERHRDGA